MVGCCGGVVWWRGVVDCCVVGCYGGVWCGGVVWWSGGVDCCVVECSVVEWSGK